MSDSLERSRALFIRRWGEMGGYWGINRTMAELHALLYTSAEPLCTDDIMAQLQISRGNASMNLRQLVDWGLINRVHKKGDRKEYFASETDVWELFQNIARERKRREVEPIVETIGRCKTMVANEMGPRTSNEPEPVRIFLDRLEAMEGFLTSMLELLTIVLNSDSKDLRTIATLMTQFAAMGNRPTI